MSNDDEMTPEFIDVEEVETVTLSPLMKRLAEVTNKAQARPKPVKDEKNEAAAMQQLDLFVADLLDYNLKDDAATMEAPLFSLSTRPDMDTWKWTSPDGKKWLEVTPSSIGRATMHDKDLLIYLTSQLVAAMNTATREKTKMPGRRIRFVLHDFMVSTCRNTSGKIYEDVEKMLDRLAGTRLKTNIEIGDIDHRTSFGLIEKFYYVLKKDGNGNKRMGAIEVTLSEWLYQALEKHNILTINQEYFTLRKPLEKRLYELARKHVGKQPEWIIGLENLIKKTGSKSSTKEFTRMQKAIIEADTLLDFRMANYASDKGEIMVRFYLKDPKKLALAYAAKEAAMVNAEGKKPNGRKPGPIKMRIQPDLLD